MLVCTIYSPVGNATLELHLFLAKTTEHESELLNYYGDTSNSQVVSITSSIVRTGCHPVGMAQVVER